MVHAAVVLGLCAYLLWSEKDVCVNMHVPKSTNKLTVNIEYDPFADGRWDIIGCDT